MNSEHYLELALLLPFGAALLSLTRLRDAVAMVFPVLGFIVVLLITLADGEPATFSIPSPIPGFALKFRADSLALIFALIASFLWAVTSFYSIGYLKDLNLRNRKRFHFLFGAAIGCTLGVAFSATLFTSFIFYELLSLLTVPLVGHKLDRDARKGTEKYVTYLFLSSFLFFLPGIFLTGITADTWEYSAGGILPAEGGYPYLIFLLLSLGFAKAALVPLHAWLPSAMVAPTPVSALLHAVAVVKAGVFLFFRMIFDIFGPELFHSLHLDVFLAAWAGLTILLASIWALKQTSLKGLLAYSTISQLSYCIFGVALLHPWAALGGLLHLAIHAFSKITLFFAAGAFQAGTHRTQISELDGLAKHMPLTAAAFTVGALSMIGIPPLAGFLSKWNIFKGIADGPYPFFLIVLIISTVLNAAYFLPVIYRLYMKKSGEIRHHRISKFTWLPLVLTASIVVLLFFYPDIFVDLSRDTLSGAGINVGRQVH